MKKLTLLMLSVCLTLSLVISTNEVRAIDFKNNEKKYYKLCSSDRLTSSNKKTCEKFNAYLKNKNKDLKEDIADQKKEIEKIENDIDKVADKLSSINNQISSKQKEINYIEKNIKNVTKQIKQKENDMKDRLYVMQTYYNSQTFLTFLFAADGLSDFFSRLNSINDITEYENELVDELTYQKKQLNKQMEALEEAKDALKEQQNNAKALQKKYEALKAKEREQLANLKEDLNESAKYQKEVDTALKEMVEETPKEDSGGNAVMGNQGDAKTGYNIAQKAISKVGSPYWWGKSGPSYFDCSGLVYWAHNAAGVKLGRTNANSYAKAGRAVSASNLQAGDIVAFKRSGASTYHHIGIYIGNGIVVHASGEGSTCQGNHASQGHVVKRTPLSSFSKYTKAYRRLY